MSQHLRLAIDKLKQMLVTMAATVEESVLAAAESLQNRDRNLAQRVIAADAQIDRIEIDVEEECLKILALHHPVAFDLRFIVSILKINNDLERIADLAVNIAERSNALAAAPPIEIPFPLTEMAQKTCKMLRASLDALVNQNVKQAKQVIADDEEVDAIHREAFTQIENGIRRTPGSLDTMISLLSISRNLERIADQTTNIAEDVIYMVEGQIVRHRTSS